MDIIKKRPQRDLNPCYRRERAVSWARLDDRDSNLPQISQSKKNPKEVKLNFSLPFVFIKNHLCLTKS